MSFIKDFESITPQEKMVNLDEQKSIPNMTFQDMKDYFDGLKESITSEMRKEMLEYINKKDSVQSVDTTTVDDNNNKEE